MTKEVLGPVLVLDHVTQNRTFLSALVIAGNNTDLPPLTVHDRSHAFACLAHVGTLAVYRARFDILADEPQTYDALGETYELAPVAAESLRIAFASCNGEENGDLKRDEEERNVMWERLCVQHRAAPFGLLLHGGDQIYADEVTKGHPLSDNWPDSLPKDPGQAALDDLRRHLRNGFFERYAAQLRSPAYAWLAARIPSLSQWDDHDICDGWGSLPRSRTYSPVGQALFKTARDMALLFQHATVEGDLPDRFHDPRGHHLGWSIDLPDLRLIAPDLRSERTRRQIMGEGGWSMISDLAARPPKANTLVMSSVPLLGPRLSILEALMIVIPKMQHYEDDLRDQWQSRAHRGEWRRMLETLQGIAKNGTDIIVLSGEIHLATHATMQLDDTRTLHQLVASGVTHRAPPQAWARTLGALASLGEDPVPGVRIAIHPIPGQRYRYTAERNFLTLDRQDKTWTAVWHFEFAGASDALIM